MARLYPAADGLIRTADEWRSTGSSSITSIDGLSARGLIGSIDGLISTGNGLFRSDHGLIRSRTTASSTGTDGGLIVSKTGIAGLTVNTTYYFRVQPLTKTGVADWSQIVSLSVT